MMRSFFLILFFPLFLYCEDIALGSLEHKPVIGSGKFIEEQRQLSSFNRLSLSGNFSVDVKIGDQTPFYIVVNTDDNLLEWVETKVEKNTLFLKYRSPDSQDPLLPASFSNTLINSSSPPKLSIYLPSLLEIVSHGSCQIHVKDLSEKELLLKLSGSSKAKISGIVDELNLRLSGSSKLDAPSLICNSIGFSISGSATALVYPKDKLEGKSSGSSILEYKGVPPFKKVESTGASLIKNID